MYEKETFEVVKRLVSQNSFGVVAEEESVKLTVNVSVNGETNRGCFEFYSGDGYWYAEGGLWFDGELYTDDFRLVDYDGVYCISDMIVDWLEQFISNADDFRYD